MEAIDTLIQDRHLEMIKAAIPYLDNSRQKNMAMLVKFMELQRTMALFQNPGNDLKMCSEEEREDPVQMLSAIREYCTDREKEVIDNIIGFVQMFSTYGTLFSAT
ncbi:hypothetical protein VSQ32_03290 [Lachnospiraceae bacterium KK002]|uniref:hypothetical protein n=1 Tax=Eubacterium sp. 14-2 TaxID=1235790 RepID=UPI0003398800|nr:hypothetical protein [Eubacterium sp. 14-2]EOT27353.1 hypothetical protein C805_01461 [Eubacterium sp. 14-2]